MSYFVRVAFTKEVEPDFISKSIMKFLDRPYSHVMVLFEDVDGREKILHAIGGGTQIDHEKAYLKNHIIVRQFKIPMKCSKSDFSHYAKGRIGRDYAETSYINMALEFLGIPWVPFKNGNDDVVCSSEVAAAVSLSELPVPEKMVLELIDPREIEDFLLSQKLAQLEI